MKSVKDTAGKVYDAAKHSGVFGLQKITEESDRITICYSYFQPNGGAEMSSSPMERIYYVVKGSITVKSENNETHLLNQGDLIYIAPGETRDMVINDGKPAEVLVIIVKP